jgi:AcrR family transcriptional regulator
MAQRLTRAEQRDLTRARLLDAAEEVFIARGFHATSVDEVAEAAGFSKGAVYSNFESKDELFLAVLDRRVDSRALAIEGQIRPDQTIADQAVEAGEKFFSVFLEQSAWSLLLMEFAAYAARHPTLRDRFGARNQRIRDAMVSLIDSHLDALGLEAPLPTDQLAAILFALGDGIILEHLTSPGGVPESLFGSALGLMLSGIKPKALVSEQS